MDLFIEVSNYSKYLRKLNIKIKKNKLKLVEYFTKAATHRLDCIKCSSNQIIVFFVSI